MLLGCIISASDKAALLQDNSRQSSSLGGVAIEAPKKLGGSQQPIQAGGSSAGTSGLFSSQTPVGSLGNAPASPQRTKLEESSSSNAWGVNTASSQQSECRDLASSRDEI